VNKPTSQGATRREILVFALGLAALFALLLFLTDGDILFTRPLWLDEWLTVFPAKRSSPFRLIGDLAAGSDGGTSLLHLAVWGMRNVLGGLSPTALRVMSLICVFTALCLLYAVLRRRFRADPSVAGALAVGSNSLVLAHAFEARFYGPWLLCSVFFAWSLARNQEPTASRDRAAVVGAAAVLLCAIHFYGVISLTIMACAVVVGYGRQWREGLRVVAPSAAGLLAVVATAPLALGHLRAYTVDTWISSFELGQLGALARRFWLTPVLLVAVAALLLGFAFHLRKNTQPSVAVTARHAATDVGIVALASLALMPAALAAMSLAGQPFMLGAMRSRRHRRGGRWWPSAWRSRDDGRRVRSGRSRVVLVRGSDARGGIPAGIRQRGRSQSRRAAPSCGITGAGGLSVNPRDVPAGGRRLGTRLAGPCFLDLPDSAFFAFFPGTGELDQLRRGITLLERDLARVHAKRFGFPALFSQAQLDTFPSFILLVPVQRFALGFSDVGEFARAAFPNHRLRRLDPDLWLLERPREAP
jgi:hypothetical protein